MLALTAECSLSGKVLAVATGRRTPASRWLIGVKQKLVIHIYNDDFQAVQPLPHDLLDSSPDVLPKKMSVSK